MTKLTYKDAGVDIERGSELVRRLAPLAARTRRPEVRAGVGGFGATFEVPVDRYPRPVLVSGTDGVGTKLRIALDHDRLDDVGIDLVAMCVNDVLTLGAEPLYFLDYYATAQLDVDRAERVVAGIARGCEQAGAALTGGETAEMPDMYAPGDLDLAGFCVGIVNADSIVDAGTARAGDVVIGIASSGPHSNGFSLIRRVLERASQDTTIDGTLLLDVLMEPTRIYARSILALLGEVRPRAMAHITGGGLIENAHRGLDAGLQVSLERSAWPEPSVFEWLAECGNIDRLEMDRTFNCGLGFLVTVEAEQVSRTLASLSASGERAWPVGELTLRGSSAAPVHIA